MTNNCKHDNKITDFHEGTIVCLDCSFVIEDQVFICNDKPEQNNIASDNDFKEILTRLHCSYEILKSENITKVSDLYNKVNKTNSVTLKQFCAVTGLDTKAVVKNNKQTVCVQNLNDMLEKFCKLFDLSYKNYTVIKEIINSKPYSGHPPLTVIGYHIYNFIKTVQKKKITIKEICNTLGISSISIQRYRKYELSLGS